MSDSPTRIHPVNRFRPLQHSASMDSHRISTPTVKYLSSVESIDLSVDQSSTSSVHEELFQWKRKIEQQLRRIYHHKLNEINNLIEHGQTQIHIKFPSTSLLDPVITLMANEFADHGSTKTQLQWDDRHHHSYDLSSNNILLCASDEHALIHDHIRSKLLLFSHQGLFSSFDWDLNEHGEICDLSYSLYLKKFFLITHFGLFLWSWQNPACRPLQLDFIKSIGGNRLCSIASTADRSDTFILYKLGSFIEHWKSHADCSSWQRVHRWSNYDLFERSDQRIRSIAMTSMYVVWTVETMANNQWRVDLLDYKLQQIRSGIEIDHLDRSSSCLLSNYSSQQFLIIDTNRHSLFLFDTEGFIQSKSDHFITKRLRNAVVLNNFHGKWLVFRLQKPNQSYFLPLRN